jgi:hypothetical protein
VGLVCPYNKTIYQSSNYHSTKYAFVETRMKGDTNNRKTEEGKKVQKNGLQTHFVPMH